MAANELSTSAFLAKFQDVNVLSLYFNQWWESAQYANGCIRTKYYTLNL